MLTARPPSSLTQRTKRSPNTRVSSPTILKLKAVAYHSAVLRGSGAFRWMWLIRYGMRGSSEASAGFVGSHEQVRAHAEERRLALHGARPGEEAAPPSRPAGRRVPGRGPARSAGRAG